MTVTLNEQHVLLEVSDRLNDLFRREDLVVHLDGGLCVQGVSNAFNEGLECLLIAWEQSVVERVERDLDPREPNVNGCFELLLERAA